jgi:NAD(P)-dependent dehydrogenase (short-subunit alcohol dehydrogenase family)
MNISRVVVTGSASGIGKAVAAACAQRGDAVFVIDIQPEAAEAAAADIGAVGWTVCDVAVPEDVERAAAAANDALGGLDLVVHAAGVGGSGPVLKTSATEARWVINVNLLGTIYVATCFGTLMAAQAAPSRLVLVGSEHSLGVPHLYGAVYTASKHGVLGYADVLRRELPSHVGVSVICPGLVATELWRSSEHRTSEFGGSAPARPAAAATMAAGMPSPELAEAVLRGVAAVEFLIVTHGHSRRYAQERWETIDAAFERQAPDITDDRYEVPVART